MSLTSARPCRFCSQSIRMLTTRKGKSTPVEDQAYDYPHGDIVPRGRYYTEEGDLFTERNMPRDTVVYKSHWDGCPGADKARKPR